MSSLLFAFDRRMRLEDADDLQQILFVPRMDIKMVTGGNGTGNDC